MTAVYVLIVIGRSEGGQSYNGAFSQEFSNCETCTAALREIRAWGKPNEFLLAICVPK